MKNIKRGDIRLCDLGIGIGSVQGGLRPALIIQNNKGNKYSPIVIVIPITSKTNCKARLPTHMVLTTTMGLKRQSLLLTKQIITINRKNVGKKLTTLNPKLMDVVDKKIGISINLKPKKHKNLYFSKKGKESVIFRKEAITMENINYINAPKFTGRNVSIEEIANATGKSSTFLREALKQGVMHFGFALKNTNSTQYSFYCPDKLVWEELGYFNELGGAR